ncbi:glycosyltransferase [Cetobacterium sp.]|uniref:glycosyltransferase n=1 Tax=Cetobacterium sp. TaxID=2071632 RepID=UPI003F33EB9F
MKKKKILFMLSTMNIGGVEKSFLSFLEFLPADKYDITLLLLEKKGGFLEFLPNHIKVEEATWYNEIKPVLMNSPYDILKEYFVKKKYLKSIRYVISYYLSKKCNNRLFYYKELIKDIPFRIENYDVAIAYAGPTEIIDYFILTRVNAKKKIGWMHFDSSKVNMNEKLYKNIYAGFNRVFAVSEEARQKLIQKIQIDKNKVKILKNIINNNLIKKMSYEKIKESETNNESLKIVTLGRLGLEKGQDLGIKALKKLIDDGIKVHWYFVGDGLDRRYYEKLVQDLNLENYVTFLGSKSNPYPYIKMADIYIQTSRHEGYCIALAEAKALEKLILTTNFTGAKEQICAGYNGLICKPNHLEIYNKIKLLINNDLKIVHRENKSYDKN